MAVIQGGKVIEGSGTDAPILNAGAPSNGTSEVQTLTFGGTPDGGTFRLAFDGHITDDIDFVDDDDAALIAAIDAALEALPNVGTGGVTVADGTLTNGVGTVTITFGGNLAKLAVPTITVNDNSLTGTSPTIAVAETTPGVTATGRGAAVGAVLIDTTNKKVYQNTGTALVPVWTNLTANPQQSAITSLTGNSAGNLGTADGALEDQNGAVTGVDGTGSNAASKADVDARLVSIGNNMAELATTQESILSALRSAGIIAS